MGTVMRKLFIAAALAATALTSAGTPAAPQLWEEVAAETAVRSGLAPQPSQAGDSGDGVELIFRDGIVYLIVARALPVEVFTILGQPVSRETLKAGVHRLKLRSRGIYILRAGSITRRIIV